MIGYATAVAVHKTYVGYALQCKINQRIQNKK